MQTGHNYPKAPITEAIIDLRAELPESVGLIELQQAHQGEEHSYPRSDQRNIAMGQLQVGKEVATTASTKPIGYVFRSADDKQVYQARFDGFTMSRLAPYKDWLSFRDEARRLWELYVAAATPQKVVRVAVRYINRIEIPLPLDDINEYLRTGPEVSSDLPQALEGFFMRLKIPLDDIKCLCLLNEAIIEPVTPTSVSVALDIDVFRTEEVPQGDEDLWELLEKLRNRKNEIFEACITDKARELFE